ncbi:hypothetical protein GCM10010277_86510 [Streptomyces longisporoflavus]|uniref:hypothetical protein n=1 Tax=Streptomyces longisporoflavus TaxID=28044 RepID=UPI00167D7E1F|nr:hypothetical protein [Streptomyces longisporoflavus]GGV72987.1 hypothetical protein GCM10010277_86510 [Streptomyces longisporoflavus]
MTTTPQRPFDVTAVFPQLAPLARTATRLHPRPGAPSPQDSSIGGPLLWPVGEPWPHCDGPHVVDGMNPALSPADVRLERRIRAASRDRSLTTQEREALERIRPPREFPLTAEVRPYNGSIAMLPVAQLYARDVPDLHAPEGADLLQVLWCPFDHPIMPRTVLFWRSAATVSHILATPPEPPAVQFDGYLPEPCLLNPEQVTEYPDHLEVSKVLQEQLATWSMWQAAGTDLDNGYASFPQEFYDSELAGAPGWKVGGWPRWGATDPAPRLCPACGSDMDALLTIATFEYSSGSSWRPDEAGEDRELISGHIPAPTRIGFPATNPAPRQPTAVQIGSGYDQQLYLCPTDPQHPHFELMH